MSLVESPSAPAIVLESPQVEIKKKRYAPTSAWHLKPANPWDPLDRIKRLDLGPPELYEAKGEDFDRGPVPTHPMWRENLFVLRWTIFPLVAQWALLRFTHVKLDTPIAIGLQFVFYQVCFITFGTRIFRRAQHFMKVYGTFNEHKRGRDRIADAHRDRLTVTLVLFLVIRTAGLLILGKGRGLTPSLSIWSPVKIGLFQASLDYFFYVYHRSTHEFDCLWFIHRKHHASKAPTPTLAILADGYQECLEIAIIPFLATRIVSLTFAELWFAYVYTAYIEAIGHAGIRAEWTTPILGPVLKPFGMDLEIEDHDIHHRYGRGGKNYGKQTRIWDRLFGTIAPREESKEYTAKQTQVSD